jgi:uncharacterized protein
MAPPNQRSNPFVIDFPCKQATCRLGVISDTHGLLRPEAIELLQDVDMIIHAGDIGPPEILQTLQTIAPVAAVRGNMDRGQPSLFLPENESILIGETMILVVHDLNRLKFNPADEGFHLVINGHTHQPLLHTVEGVMYLNPGSAGPRRFTLPVSLGRVELKNERISVRHFDLDQYKRNGRKMPASGCDSDLIG